MKLIGRSLIILAAALVVVGATFAIVRSGTVSAMERGPGRAELARGGGEPAAEQAASPGREAFVGRPGGRPGGAMAWLFGLGELGRSFGIVAITVLLVAPLQRLMLRRRAAARVR